MSKINNEIKNINNAIFKALKESAANEVSMWEASGKSYKDKNESQKVNSNNLTKEQLWKLRQEIVLGSLYLDDYKNSFGIDPQAVCSFFDSFIEDAQQDDEGNFNNRKTKEFDNAEELYNYYLTCENPFGELNESQSLKETGEWDDNDDEMALWLEDLRDQAQELANQINGEVKTVKGFDKYQGPFAVVHSPKHGDIMVWYDQEDDTGRSFNAKVAHVGWITGGINNLADLLNQDTIPENEVLSEGSMEDELGKEADEWLEDQNRRLYRRLKKKYGPEKAYEIVYGESDSSEDKSSLKEGVFVVNNEEDLNNTVILLKDIKTSNGQNIVCYKNTYFVVTDEELEELDKNNISVLNQKVRAKNVDDLLSELSESSLKEERVNMVVHKGDVFENQNGIKCTIVDVDNEHTIEGEPQVMFRFTSNNSNTQGETTKTVPMKNVVRMLNQNGYKKVY